MKVCRDCGQAKSLEDFYLKPKTLKSGERRRYPQARCKKCQDRWVVAWRVRKTKERREANPLVGTISRPAYAPWSIAIIELLKDGEWHDWNEVIKAGAAAVPPGQAFRRGYDTASKDQADVIAAGARTKARQIVYSLLRRRLIEREGSKLRMKLESGNGTTQIEHP